MIDLKDIKDYCIKHACIDCPIDDECYTMLGSTSPATWQDDAIEKIEKEIINDRD